MEEATAQGETFHSDQNPDLEPLTNGFSGNFQAENFSWLAEIFPPPLAALSAGA